MAFYRFCSPYVDVCDFEQEREQHQEESFCAAMWSVLLREMHRRMQEGDFPAVCNLHRDIARLYELDINEGDQVFLIDGELRKIR